VAGIGGILAAVEVLDEGEDLLADGPEHLLRLELPETRPAQLLLPYPEDRLLDRLPQPVGLLLPRRVDVIQPFYEQQEGYLLYNPQRIGNPPGPECVPYLVDLAFIFTGQHLCSAPVISAY